MTIVLISVAGLAIREVRLGWRVTGAVSLLAGPGSESVIAVACLTWLAAYWTASSAITLLKSR